MMIVNGPVYFLNKPLGNTIMEKQNKSTKQKTWVVCIFPGKAAAVQTVHTHKISLPVQ